jgi:hypothetical protein
LVPDIATVVWLGDFELGVPDLAAGVVALATVASFLSVVLAVLSFA